MGNKRKDQVQGSREPGESRYRTGRRDSTKVEGSPLPQSLKEQVGGKHYKELKIQPIEYILANDLPFIEGNIVKYITRWKQKGGIEDIKKVIHYAEILLEHNE